MALVPRLVSIACLAAGLFLGAGVDLRPAAADEPAPGARERDLEPVPREVAFGAGEDGRFQERTRALIEETIQRTFSSLGDVSTGRDVLVRRFGVLCVPALTRKLKSVQNVTETWNVALTVGALRDTEGAATAIQPALRPLVPLIQERGKDPHIRALAALAVGCFHWPEAVLPERYKKLDGDAYYTAVPGPALTAQQASGSLTTALRALVNLTSDKFIFASVSGFFALAKIGGTNARDALFAKRLPDFANEGPLRASLLTHAFLVREDPRPLLESVGKKEELSSWVRGTAALAIAVALLQEQRAEWTLTDGRDILKRLKTGHAGAPDDAENVFARGVCAHVFQLNDEWDELWKCAVAPSTKGNCAESACQMLAFCELPHIEAALVKQAGKKGSMHHALLALSLLRAGRSGTAEGLENVHEWLRGASRRPKAEKDWDPRWYAAIGLLRAFHQGRIRGRQERVDAVSWLRKALDKNIFHKDAAIRPVLARVLEDYGDRITKAKDDAALYRLPYAALRAVQRSFTCPYGLMTDDPVDACVQRVNGMVWDIYGLDALKPNKPGEKSKQPERYLKRYLSRYPYFSRLEFRTGRGYRGIARYETADRDDPDGDPLVIDR